MNVNADFFIYYKKAMAFFIYYINADFLSITKKPWPPPHILY